ncbi:MAG: hypothetical protein ACRECV_10295 [Xanthobacteraceae bacterium]
MSPTLKEQFADYDKLPDDAIVPDPVAAKILAISIWTLRRNNPVPARQISERRRGRRVGDLRAKVRGIESKVAA